MSIAMSVFESLVSGGTWIRDGIGDRAEQLDITWAAQGGYWNHRFTQKMPQWEVEEWIDTGLGRHIEIYNSALDIIFEGFVSSVSGNIGSLTIQRGPLLDTVGNRIRCVYSTIDTTTTPPTLGVRESTSVANDADSQGKYGIIEKTLSVGGSTLANAEQIRDTALEDMREPTTDEKENLERSDVPSVTIEVLGYVHWLKAYTYASTTTGLQNADVKIEAILAADPNSIFSTNYRNVAVNATQVGAWEQSDRTAWALIQGITALGDSSNNRWLFGFYKDREAKYDAIPTTVKYQRRLSDPGQWIETYGAGGRIKPWNVTPGEWVFYTDLFVGKSPAIDYPTDPRYLFIEQNTWAVPWALTMDGAKVGRLDQLLARLGLAGAGV
jgi:hypothetical protein